MTTLPKIDAFSPAQEATVPALLTAQRVDSVLAQLFPEYSRSQLTQWLKTGFITVNQNILKPREKVFGGEAIVLHAPTSRIRQNDIAQDIPLNIIYEDEDLLVINKPAGLVVHPGAGNPQNTLVNALLYHDETLQQLPRAGIIHRLDKDTTGLLVIAKTLQAHTSLVRQMQAREIERHYVTLVRGHLISGDTIETNFGRDSRNRLKMSVCTHGKEAITRFTIRKHYQKFTLLNVSLMTGRTHQIRVHMAHIKHPVIGDSLYGGGFRRFAGMPDELAEGMMQFQRQALHAATLSFLHPITKKELTFSAPLPHDFELLLNLLDDHLGIP